MNMKFKLDGKVFLTVSLLLTTMWLPLTTSAQSSSKTGAMTDDMHIQADNCTYCQTKSGHLDSNHCLRSQHALTHLPNFGKGDRVESVGFGETDPAKQQTQKGGYDLHKDVDQVMQSNNGFAETDPVDLKPLVTMTNVQKDMDRVLQSNIGFAETDPVTDIYQSIGEINHGTVVDCLGGMAKDIAFTAPRSSNLTE